MKQLTGKPWRWLSVVILIGLFISNGNGHALAQDNEKDEDDEKFSIVKNLDIFYSLFRELNTYYVDETDPEKLVETSIESMLESLDPYTDYIPESEMDDFNFMTTGNYAGIGALITRKGDNVYVSEPYKGFPADEAGIKAGDKILAIDGEEMKGKPTDQVSNHLKGPAKSEVTVTVERYGEEDPMDIEIVRRNIQINPVSYHGMVDDETGLIILNNFTRDCTREVEKALEELKEKEGAEKVILDLRGNPGGLMEEAVNLANLFLPKGSEVVSTKGKIERWDKDYRAPREPVDTVIPLTVLIDRRSASASEIVAGAIQDHDRGVIVGNRSFGKGLVQTTRNLPYNTKLKVTTAKYYIPSGRCIQAHDYSELNEDGSLSYVPDSLISKHETAKGRTVYDGGGISPDVIVDNDRYSNVIYALMSQQTIFGYANRFQAEHDSLPEPSEFSVTDEIYEDFVSYVESLDDFRYTSESKERYKKLEEAAREEGYYEVNNDVFKEMREKLDVDVSHDLQTFRDEVERLLADELLKRYYYRSGAIKHSLDKDRDLNEAIEVLNDEARYKGILDGSVPSHAGDRRKIKREN
ncbi:MAG: S41 family peptidase [Marinilabiliaceae bacterium]